MRLARAASLSGAARGQEVAVVVVAEDLFPVPGGVGGGTRLCPPGQECLPFFFFCFPLHLKCLSLLFELVHFSVIHQRRFTCVALDVLKTQVS